MLVYFFVANYSSSLKVKFVDIDLDTLNINLSVEKFQKNESTHASTCLGNCADDKINKWCGKNKIILIEDAWKHGSSLKINL